MYIICFRFIARVLWLLSLSLLLFSRSFFHTAAWLYNYLITIHCICMCRNSIHPSSFSVCSLEPRRPEAQVGGVVVAERKLFGKTFIRSIETYNRGKLPYSRNSAGILHILFDSACIYSKIIANITFDFSLSSSQSSYCGGCLSGSI